MVNLKDNQGQEIRSGPDHWYKIVLRNGRELTMGGFKYEVVGTADPGWGMVVRYQRYNGDDRLHQGWPIGDRGYFRCLLNEHTGKLGVAGPLKTLGVTVEDSHVHGIRAEQLPGNRVSLYAYDEDGKLYGLRFRGNGALTLALDFGDFPVGLDCEFVKVSNAISKGLF